MKLPDERYFFKTQFIEKMILHRKRHLEKGNTFGLKITSVDGVARSVTTNPVHATEANFIGYRIEDQSR